MSHPADTEVPLDARAKPAVENDAAETSPEGQPPALSPLANGNGIDGPKENIEQPTKPEPEAAPAPPAEQPLANGTPQKAITTEEEVQSPVQETPGNGESDTVQANGDASGNVRIPKDADLAKPERDDEEQKGGKKVRRSSTLSTIAEKAKTFIPRGKVNRRTAASHGRSGGGCVIF